MAAGSLGGLLGSWLIDRNGGEDRLIPGWCYGLGRIAPAMRMPLAGVGLAAHVASERRREKPLSRAGASWGMATTASFAGICLVEWIVARWPATGSPRRVALVANSHSGSQRMARRGLRALRREPVELVSVERAPPGELSEALRRAARRLGPEGVLVAAGGDGTVGLAAATVAGARLHLGILPTGTGNDIARSLRVPLCPEEAAGTVARGSIVAMDLGATPAGSFAHAATVGMTSEFADLVHGVRGWVRPWRYPICAYRAWRGRHPLEIDIRVDGKQLPIDDPPFQVAIVNAPRIGGRIGVDLPRARSDDGLLHLVSLSSGALRDILTEMAHLVGARVRQVPRRAVVQAGRRIEISSPTPEVICLDGEPATTTPLSVGVSPGACSVLVPASSGSYPMSARCRPSAGRSQ
ncbi:MAG TPA: diacylglycerol kinase family protein [Acidimicrobiales bacterium]|nr:diacylglycerol kinase family protein [Acidimicrobiales bacterium]